MRRALQRANTFHVDDSNQATTPSTDAPSPTPFAPPTVETPSMKLPVRSLMPDPNNSARKEKHSSSRRNKRRERSNTKTAALPQTTSVPDLARSKKDLDPTSPLAIAASKNGISRTQINLSEIFTKVSAAWTKPVQQTPLAVDLPRLASRITVQDVRGGKNDELCAGENEQPKDLIAKIIYRVTEIVESDKSLSEKIHTYCEKSKEGAVDLRKYTEDLLEMVGNDSKTVAVCKTINQNIIMAVATQIKVIIFSLTNGFTKDVRTVDGWRILLRFTDDEVICTHIKKEASMAVAQNSFEFEWHLTLRFSLLLEKLEKVELLLTGLTCNEGMAKEQKQKLTDAMTHIVVDD